MKNYRLHPTMVRKFQRQARQIDLTIGTDCCRTNDGYDVRYIDQPGATFIGAFNFTIVVERAGWACTCDSFLACRHCRHVYAAQAQDRGAGREVGQIARVRPVPIRVTILDDDGPVI